MRQQHIVVAQVVVVTGIVVVAASLWPFMLHKLQRLSFVTCVKIDCNFWLENKKKNKARNKKLGM